MLLILTLEDSLESDEGLNHAEYISKFQDFLEYVRKNSDWRRGSGLNFYFTNEIDIA